MAEWLNTRIEQDTSNGSTTTQTETGGSATSNETTTGSQSQSAAELQTPSLIAPGSRVSSNAVTTPGNMTQKSHYAMSFQVTIPIHNRQPVANV